MTVLTQYIGKKFVYTPRKGEKHTFKVIHAYELDGKKKVVNQNLVAFLIDEVTFLD